MVAHEIGFPCGRRLEAVSGFVHAEVLVLGFRGRLTSEWRSRVGFKGGGQLRLDLQRWFLDSRVGRIHRWRKSQCDRELLSAQMLHRKRKQGKPFVTDHSGCSFLRLICESAPPGGAESTFTHSSCLCAARPQTWRLRGPASHRLWRW